jgi:hypothetical protein
MMWKAMFEMFAQLFALLRARRREEPEPEPAPTTQRSQTVAGEAARLASRNAGPPIDILGACPHCGVVTTRVVRERTSSFGLVRCYSCNSEFVVQI